MLSYALLVPFILIFSSQHASAGGNDWVNPSFVLRRSGAPSAQRTINSYAKSSARKGPWTVYGGDASILPPNEDKRDYLSWAPYHWPDCDWCQGGRMHLSTGGNQTSPEAPSNTTQVVSDDDDDGGDVEYGDDGDGPSEDGQSDENEDEDGSDDSTVPLLGHPVSAPVPVPRAHRRMIRRARHFGHTHQKRYIEEKKEEETSSDSLPSNLLPIPIVDPNDGVSSTSTNGEFATSQTGVENARKTSKPRPRPKGKSTHKAAPTKTKGGGSNCTPSPTKGMAPSSTWTTCKYVTRDGRLNPDVRKLHGVQAIADASQSILYNAIASVLTGSTSYAETATQAINTFFLDAHSGMHPRIQYGQVIRGPQEQVGQYLGVLDFRSMVKVVNAILIMQATKPAAWTSSLESQMQEWTSQYVKWLQTSTLGRKAISAPNNHGTFATNQLAAMNILAGDKSAAAVALNSYFTGQFLDQIAESGEQPFEAVRTRPFHYRCFNLEAMITNAKLGDQLGLDFWSAKSKYGATIKDALDFVMKRGPGKEKAADIFPHVAAVAAAYGDPGGRYMAYLRRMDSHFMTAPYYYYDQSAALTHAQKYATGKEDTVDGIFQQPPEPQEFDMQQEELSDSLPDEQPKMPWECPAAFEGALSVQLDDGLFVTCGELKPFYGYI